MTALLIGILILMLVLVLVHVLAQNLPGLAPYKNVLMIVTLVIGVIILLSRSGVLGSL